MSNHREANANGAANTNADALTPEQRYFLGEIIKPDKGCTEVRVFDANADRSGRIVKGDGYKGVYTAWFDDPSKLMAEARRLDGVSAYVTVNPANEALLGRADKLSKNKHATSDDDIVCLSNAFLDVDPERPADVSATESERLAAIECLKKILEDHPDIAASACWGSSGNGQWALLRLPDLPNDKDHRDVLERFTKALSKLYSGKYGDVACKVDEATYNAGRVMATVGTMKCKGVSTAKRPHRPVTLASPVGKVRTEFDIAGWLAKHEPPAPPETKPAAAKPKAEPKSQPATKPRIAGSGVCFPQPVLEVWADFNARGDWIRDVVTPAGWKVDRTQSDGKIFVTRPSKSVGVSATIGHEGADVFYPFTDSSEIKPLEPRKGASKFYTYVALIHGGDRAAAMKSLSAAGYGTYRDHDGTEKQNPPPDDWAKRNGSRKGNGDRGTKPTVADPTLQHKLSSLSNGDLGVTPAKSIIKKPINWLWPYRLAIGEMALLAGDGGLGKSSILLAIAAWVSRQAAWPDGGGNAPHGHILIVSAEDSPETTLVPRLEALGADLDHMDFVSPGVVKEINGDRVVDPQSLKDRAYWKEVLCRFPDCKLLIVDPLPSYLGQGVSDSKNQEVRAVIEPFIEHVVRPAGICFIANTHLNKAVDNKNPMHRIMGSVAYVNLARNVHFVVADPENRDRALFKQAKCNNAPKNLPALAYTLVKTTIPSEFGDIETSYPEFEKGLVEFDLGDAMAGDAGSNGASGNASQRDKCAKWLIDYLWQIGVGVELDYSRLINAAGDNGFAGKTNDQGRWSNPNLLSRAIHAINDEAKSLNEWHSFKVRSRLELRKGRNKPVNIYWLECNAAGFQPVVPRVA
jgi:hypothetical protein